MPGKMPENSPLVSVVIPSYQPGEELRRCLDAILSPYREVHFDLWIVDSSPRDVTPLLGEFLSDPRVRLVSSGERLFPGAARDLGVRSSRGEVIVFTDCDCTAGPRWLERLLDGLEEGGCAACGGGVENGTPASAFGTAEYLSEFSMFTPRNPARRERFVPTCNMAVRREAYFRAGGLEPGLEKGSDVALGRRLVELGEEIAFVPGACVYHHNRTGAREVLRNQYRLGRGVAGNFLAGNQPYSAWSGSRLKTLLLTLGAAPARFTRVAARVAAHREISPARALALLPALASCAACFGAGFAVSVFNRER
jgi:GT2 family glycosyltransferase